jgi:hypothetical protein
MTDCPDPATTVLAENRYLAQPKSYAALSKSSGIPASTLRDRDRGRISKRERAANQQYLSPQEERSLVEHSLRMSKNGYPLPIKYTFPSVGDRAATVGNLIPTYNRSELCHGTTWEELASSLLQASSRDKS